MLSNLGELYRQMGRYSAAEPLFKRALEIREAAYSADDPRVAASVSLLGGLYRLEGRLPESFTGMKAGSPKPNHSTDVLSRFARRLFLPLILA